MTWLAWLAPLPFFLALPAPAWRSAAAFGWAVGTGVALVVIAPWLWPAMRAVLAVEAPTRAALLLGVVQMVGGLPFAALGLIAHAGAGIAPARRVLLLAAAWAGLEYLRAHLPLGTPWAVLGSALADTPRAIQIADVGGVYAVSFLAALPSATAAVALTAPRDRRTAGAILCGTTLMVLALAYGGDRLRATQAAMATAPAARLALVHADLSSTTHVAPADAHASLERHLALTPAGESVDLVVWPENAVPALLADNPHLVEAIARQGGGTPYLVGAPRMTSRGGRPVLRASALLIDGRGIRATYDKRALLPVAETAPAGWLAGTTALAFSPGEGAGVIDVGSLRVAPLICYEAIFPALARAAVRSGATLLVNISNDAWLPRAGARQHFLFARLRAVEVRRALVRVANRGVTAVVDPDGSERILGDGDRPGAAVTTVPRLEGLTVYARVGDVFSWLCICYVAVTLLAGVRAARGEATGGDSARTGGTRRQRRLRRGAFSDAAAGAVPDCPSAGG